MSSTLEFHPRSDNPIVSLAEEISRGNLLFGEEIKIGDEELGILRGVSDYAVFLGPGRYRSRRWWNKTLGAPVTGGWTLTRVKSGPFRIQCVVTAACKPEFIEGGGQKHEIRPTVTLVVAISFVVWNPSDVARCAYDPKEKLDSIV